MISHFNIIFWSILVDIAVSQKNTYFRKRKTVQIPVVSTICIATLSSGYVCGLFECKSLILFKSNNPYDTDSWNRGRKYIYQQQSIRPQTVCHDRAGRSGETISNSRGAVVSHPRQPGAQRELTRKCTKHTVDTPTPTHKTQTHAKS